jgi:alcohol dehydrogenase class IV
MFISSALTTAVTAAAVSILVLNTALGTASEITRLAVSFTPKKYKSGLI